MANPFSKGWKYLTQSLDSKIEENADPKVQIQQALEQSKKQHAEVTQAAAQVIGNRNQLEMKMNRLHKDAEKLKTNTQQALQQADAATNSGDAAKAQKMNETAEVFASQLVTVEQELEDTKRSYGAAVEAAKQAEQQQKQSEARLQENLAQINQLQSQVEQAKMQEATSASMQQLQGMTNSDDVPTLDGVRDKIERRYANALGAQELAENSVGGRMQEIQADMNDFKATSRLDQIRAEMNGGNQLNSGSSDQQGQLNAGTDEGGSGTGKDE